MLLYLHLDIRISYLFSVESRLHIYTSKYFSIRELDKTCIHVVCLFSLYRSASLNLSYGLLQEETFDWSTAREKCSDEENSSLVSMETEKEWHFVHNLTKKKPANKAPPLVHWLGKG